MQKQFMKKLLSVPYYEHVEDHSSLARPSGRSMCALGTCRTDRGAELALLDEDDQMHTVMQDEAARPSRSLAWTTATL
jgi:hypothetical protein